VIHFEEKIGVLERIIGNLESERDDLRRRLDKEAEERREAQTKLTALLTHQPESKADTPSALPKPKIRAAVRPWLWVALAVASVAAVIVEWLVYYGRYLF
jgi:hypothetical protein